MSSVFAYLRASLSGPPITKQAADAVTLFQEHLAPLEYVWKTAFQDDADAGLLPLANRPAGFKLLAHLRSGDAIIIPHASLAFRNQNDLVRTLRSWRDGRVRVCVPDLGLGGDANGLGMLIAAAEGLIGLRSAWHREQIARKRASGRLSGQHPYGFKGAGPRGRRRQVPDEEERQIGASIVQWKHNRSSWEEIFWHLSRLGVRNRYGREWSIWSIRKAYEGELRLQAEEKQCEPEPSA